MGIRNTEKHLETVKKTVVNKYKKLKQAHLGSKVNNIT